VFTGFFDSKTAGEYPYMLLDGGSAGEVRRGRPPAELLRREVDFEDLPEGERRRVLEVYRGMWALGGD